LWEEEGVSNGDVLDHNMLLMSTVTRSLLCELENGRLAMLAFIVQVLFEVFYEKNSLTILKNWIRIPNFDSVDLILF
jgi:hypothetical protein